jgi:hypothetical protein
MMIEEIKSGYNKEIALVLLCCRVYLGIEQPQTLKEFIKKNDIDWKKVYQLSRVHRIRPVVYKILSAFKEIIEEAALERFRNFCLHCASGAFNKKIESDRILAILHKNSIKAKLYKGLDLAQLAYGDTGMRESSDIDIIIERKDAPAIITLMEKEGYEMKEKDFYSRFPERFMKRHKDIVFQKANLSFEFHFDPVMYFSIPVPDFAELLGKDYLLNSRQYGVGDYFKLMIINNGVADYYPDLRSVMDNAVLYQQLSSSEKQAIAQSADQFVQLWSYLAKQLFQLAFDSACYKPCIITNYTLQQLLQLQEKKRKRMLFVCYSYFNILFSKGVSPRSMQFYRSAHFLLTPNGNDISKGSKPFIFYYFSKPFRLLVNLFSSFFLHRQNNFCSSQKNV